MTIAITHAGEGTNTAGSGGTTQWSFQVGLAFAVYDYLIISIASDNSGTSGANSISSVQDSQGNSYSLIGSMHKSNAASVNDSGDCRVYGAQITVALAATDTISINQSPATPRGAAVVHKVTCGSTSYLTFPIVATDDGFSTGPTGFAIGTNTTGDAIIASVAAEYNTTPAAIDSDSTGGASWCSPTHSAFSNSGTTTSSQAIGTQHKVGTTSGAAQSWTCTYAASCDWEAVAIFIRETAAATPSAISPPTVTPNAVGGFGLSWSAASTPAGGRPITDYLLWYSFNNSDWYLGGQNISVGSPALSKNVTGFSPGQLVYWRIEPWNAIGGGAWSTSSSGTTWNVPSQVTNLSGTNPGTGTFTLNWTAPSNGGSAITDYIVEWSYKGENSWSVWSHSALGAVNTCNVTGLQHIYSYDFRIKAISAVGTATSYSNTATVEGKSRPSWGGMDLSRRSSL